ncbi:hypothetical protein [Microseira wollei]|uniref:Uncharacterized protein n=1 Tax=Microseira wollei NIES-4236 TaxID=2530354 RepID=A0AAV3X8E8_9CYAN|nr:hypothetical protein [Microseira wollei]GET37561.1 hypothetical protein MiSe_23150 [Microseira wollei NIES-4236]
MINIVCRGTAAENLRVNGKAYLCRAPTKIVDTIENFSNSDATVNDIIADCTRMRYTFVCVAAPLRVPLHKRSDNAFPHAAASRCISAIIFTC